MEVTVILQDVNKNKALDKFIFRWDPDLDLFVSELSVNRFIVNKGWGSRVVRDEVVVLYRMGGNVYMKNSGLTYLKSTKCVISTYGHVCGDEVCKFLNRYECKGKVSS